MGALWVAKSDGFWWSGATKGTSWVVSGSLSKAGFTLVRDEQFATIDPARWFTYNNSTFGSSGGRIQTYMAANAAAGTGTSGATSGTSLKLTVLETDAGSGTLPSPTDAGTRYSYTAGMLDSRSVGVTYPRYGYFEWRAKVPHGQGLWPSFWLTCDVAHGGAGMAEFDIVEYFHAAAPGKNSSTIHGTPNSGPPSVANRYTNNGSAANGIGGRTFFEAPTATPGWHTWGAEIVPVTDATGNTLANPTQPSSYVRLTVFLDGVQAWRVVDTSALYYTTNGGTEDNYWNVFLQGCQVDSKTSPVGHPRDPLGYGHWQNACTISGSTGSCALTSGGYTIRRAQFDGVANVTEVDYMRVWKFTG